VPKVSNGNNRNLLIGSKEIDLAALDLTLTEARVLYAQIRNTCSIEVKPHAYKDHPGRMFDAAEIVDIIRNTLSLHRNTSKTAIPKSFLVIAKDDRRRPCEFSVLFMKDKSSGHYIVVCHAFREV